MEKKIPTLLVVEDDSMSRLLQKLLDPDITVRQEYRSVAAAVGLIETSKVGGVLTGWKIRKGGDAFSWDDELAAPQIVAAARRADIPVVVVSSHPDSRKFQVAPVIDKTTMDLGELKNYVRAMLGFASTQA